MSDRDEKLAADFGTAAELAVADHLNMLRTKLPAQEIDVTSPKTGEVVTIQNPLWIKLRTLKSRAASDIIRVLSAIDPQSMKGRKTNRLQEIIAGIEKWKQPGGHKPN